jgi:hypothetical protein
VAARRKRRHAAAPPIVAAVVIVRAKARPSPARQGEQQECQRVSTKTPHPQGARAREQRERVRPSSLPHIFETLPLATIPKRVRDKTPHSLHFTFLCALATDTGWRRLQAPGAKRIGRGPIGNVKATYIEVPAYMK